MRTEKVNLLSDDAERGIPAFEPVREARPATRIRPARPQKKGVKFFVAPLLIAMLFVGSFGIGRLSLSQAATGVLAHLEDIPVIGRVLTASPNRELQGEDDGRINILLLGMGGEGHEGPFLTDTIMVASVKPGDNKVAMLSIPRDLLVPLPDIGWRKINSANAFGEMDNPGRGADYTREVLQDLLGIDIPYYVRADFEGFKSVIDSVGGIDVYVEKTFTDYTYPTNDYGIQVVSFKEGWRHLGGEEALKFARSRHGNNGEGTDFARAKRQQKVLTALKEKMLTASTFKNPATVANTLSALQANISTNISIGEILRLAKMARQIDQVNIVHKVLDNGPESPLRDAMYGGAYVLLPRDDDWQGLRQIASDLFELGVTDATMQASENKEGGATGTTPPKPTAMEKARVEILNGSGKAGQARIIATSLSGAGFQVAKIGNAPSFDYDQSVIYDLTGGDRADALEKLKQTTGASSARNGAPTGTTSDADFIFIIGKDAIN